jgi:hypothetical protein
MKRLLPLAILLLIGAGLAVFSALQAFPDPRPAAERLDDLAGNPVSLLRSLPGVAEVWRSGSISPTVRIVHLQDWHAIPPDLHALDGGKNGQSYADHLDEVEAVQADLLALLRALAEEQGVKEVLAEGLTPDGMMAWRARLDAYAEAAGQQTDLQRTLEDADRLGKPDLVRKALELLEQHRRDRLDLGPVGVLQAEGCCERCRWTMPPCWMPRIHDGQEGSSIPPGWRIASGRWCAGPWKWRSPWRCSCWGEGITWGRRSSGRAGRRSTFGCACGRVGRVAEGTDRIARNAAGLTGVEQEGVGNHGGVASFPGGRILG